MIPNTPRALLCAFAATLVLASQASSFAASPRPQQNTIVSTKGSPRVEALLAQMTLEEKAGQLNFNPLLGWKTSATTEAAVPIDEAFAEQIRNGKIGAIYAARGVLVNRELQRVAVEESRLGIPIIFGVDRIHGEKTIFPVPLGEAASWEPELARRTARATAVESTALGLQWNMGPMVDLARDQRWGRVVEGAGEDPVLGSAFAAARVRGYQGEDLRAPDSMVATVKHFAAYSASQAGRDYAAVDISLQTLHDTLFPPYKAGVDAGALVVMTSFNDINGVPSTGNHWLLTEVLRGEWGFQGMIVSDAGSDQHLVNFGYASNERDASRRAALAGLDMSLWYDLPTRHLPDLVRSGEVPEARLTDAARRVLMLKEKIGLLDDPYQALDLAREADRSWIPVHDALAREAAQRSMVLLKNEGGLLPLRKSGQRIALIGPFAQDRDNIQGPWAWGDQSRFITLETGIREAMADGSLLEVVKGSDFQEGLPGGIEAAVAAAARADVVLLAVGEPQAFSGEGQSRSGITIPPAQQALAEAVAATGTPVVILLRNGRALALEGAVRDAQSILVTWFLGTQNGHAIADVVFGDYNPSAKLPVTFPTHSGQQPYYYNLLRGGLPEMWGWHHHANRPLYAFGHGLSYTTFDYGAPQLSSAKLAWDGELRVTTTITNTGKVAGEEVVQLYIHDRVASRVRPVRELKRFTKIALAPGEAREVAFSLSRADLAFTRADGVFEAEPGLFDLWVSSASDAGQPVQFELQPAAQTR